MKFHDLDIQNFLTISKARVNLADRGLQLVQGSNDDDSSASSNGAGKSSMVDAISWCLYGLTAREVKGDAVVNLAAKKDCCVSLTMTNGVSKYTVTRHRKDTRGKNSLTVEVESDSRAGVMVDLSRGTDAETQKVVESLLGCSHGVFMAAVYSGQEVMPDLPKMKDRELKTLIEEAAGLQRIEKAYELARERANAAKSTATVADNHAATIRTELARLAMTSAEVTAKHQRWEDERAVRVSESADVLLRATAEMEHAVTARDALFSGRCDALVRTKAIDEQLAAHRALERNAQAAEKEVRTAEMAIDTGLLKRLMAQVTLHQTQIANAATEIKKPCTECGTVLETMSVEDYVKHRTLHLEQARAKLDEGKKVATAQVVTLKALREVAAAHRAAVPDVSELTTSRTALVAEANRWVDLDNAAALRSRDLKAANDQLALRRTEPNPHASALAMCETQTVAASTRLEAANAALGAALKAQEVAAAVAKVFGPAGVRAQILDAVTPFLNTRTSDYLSALSDGEIQAVWTTLTKSATGDLKEKFSIDVAHSKGGDSFLALSGGEKRKVRIACALALQDLVASRATQPLDLFIGDEIDDALDPAGLERLMTILERKARERGTVLVISHSDLKDWCDNVTVVRKVSQWTSVVEGALCA
jgi:DNA repair exonuclease SbcCD ATPase subunit